MKQTFPDHDKVYDCYTQLVESSFGDRIRITVIKDQDGFNLITENGELLRDMSDDGFLEFVNSHTSTSLNMLIEEMKWIPPRILKGEDKEFNKFIKEFENRIAYIKSDFQENNPTIDED